MAKVYLHIGLPKTATTSLQIDYFPFVNNEEYFYAGVNQPRKSNSSELYYLLNQVVATGKNVDLAQSETRKIISQGRSLVLSDEMFLVSSRAVTWQLKIERLISVFDIFDYKILLTVRDPVKAMFSFYTEMYSRYSDFQHGWEWLAENNNDFRVYHYEYLLGFLTQKVDSSRIKIWKFENIVSGDLSGVDDFLDHPRMSQGYSGIKKRNEKKTRGNDDAVPVVVARKYLILSFISRLIKILGFSRGLVVWGWGVWKYFGFLKSEEKYLVRPTEEQMMSLMNSLPLLQGELCKKYGADYKYVR